MREPLACRSVLKTLACRGLRVSPSKGPTSCLVAHGGCHKVSIRMRSLNLLAFFSDMLCCCVSGSYEQWAVAMLKMWGVPILMLAWQQGGMEDRVCSVFLLYPSLVIQQLHRSSCPFPSHCCHLHHHHHHVF